MNTSTLLSTVNDLRQDLELAVSKIKTLEKDNQAYADLTKTLKNENKTFQKQLQEISDVYTLTLNEKFEAERQSEAFLEHVKVQLSEKTAEFELLRDKFTPQDVDFIRLKIQEEIEFGFKSRLQAKDNEINDLRQQVSTLSRSSQHHKTQFESMQEKQRKEYFLIKEEKDVVITSLQQELLLLRAKESNKSNEDVQIKMKVTLNELLYKCKLLQDEIQSLKDSRDAIEYEHEKLKSMHQQTVTDFNRNLLSLETESVKNDKKITVLSSTLDAKVNEAKALQMAHDNLQSENRRLAKALSNKENLLTDATENFLKNKQLVLNDKEVATRESQQLIDELSLQLRSREDLILSKQKELMHLQARMESMESEKKKERSIGNDTYYKKANQAGVDLIEAQNAYRKMESLFTAQVEAVRRENDSLHSELKRTRSENTLLTEKLHTFDFMQGSGGGNSLQRAMGGAFNSDASYSVQGGVPLSAASQGLRGLEERSALERLQHEYKASVKMIHDESLSRIKSIRRNCSRKIEKMKEAEKD